jgi:hypothetical protein
LKFGFDSMVFRAWNGTCEIKLEYSGQNLSKKSRTDQDFKWNKHYFIFKINTKYFDYYKWNRMELIPLMSTSLENFIRPLYFES